MITFDFNQNILSFVVLYSFLDRHNMSGYNHGMIYNVYSNCTSNLPLMIENIGISHNPGIYHTNGFHSYFWYYCSRGKGELHMDGQIFLISGGDGFLIYPDESYSMKQLTPDWCLDFVQFSGSLCSEILQALSMTQSNVYHFFDLRLFHKHILSIYRIHRRDSDRKAELLSKSCYDLLVDLPGSVFHADRKELRSADGSIHESVASVLQYLEIHFSEDITLEKLSVHTGYEKKYLCSVFKHETQRTIMTELAYIRIGHARTLLKQYPAKKVYEIARMCGYSDANYFGRIFRKITGTTPDQFRKTM